MTYQGTYGRNRRTTVTTSPDCVVFVNGEPTLPSQASPNRRINIQPLIKSVSVDLNVSSPPGSASLDLKVPEHYRDDFYKGGEVIFSHGMEVQIFFKGHFLAGGAPKYYPAFWGLVTSIQSSWSGGERTVSLSCSDIMWFWQNQKKNINPAYIARQIEHQTGDMSGHYYTGMNPFSIIYSLSRHVFGDSMNVDPGILSGTERRTEASQSQARQMMAYWSKKWGRITNTLRMLGPQGRVIQGSRLSEVLKREVVPASGKAGLAYDEDSDKYRPYRGGIDLSQTTPFKLDTSKMVPDLKTSEFASKLSLAQTTADTIGYEFYMDTTGEIIFKPPFYNLDTTPNYPVSWVRDIDIISQNFSQNEPEFTFIEGTGSISRSMEVGMKEQEIPKATYVDYELVLKYGWRKAEFTSEFIGAGSNNAGASGKDALFFHLIDKMDRQKAVETKQGSVSIPIRPELRLGYPVFIPNKDAYFYVEGISHSFEYGGQCTTDLTLSARRGKFYADFDTWADGEPPERGGPDNHGDRADPNVFVSNLGSRPPDNENADMWGNGTGTPVGDKNVVMYPADRTAEDLEVSTFEKPEGKQEQEGEINRLVSQRTQYTIQSTPQRYVYESWTDEEAISNLQVEEVGRIENNQITGQTITAGVFPVSDSKGYEHIGSYAYGRNVEVTPNGLQIEEGTAGQLEEARNLVFMEPTTDPTSDVPSLDERRNSGAPSNRDSGDTQVQINPNNYGRQLNQLEPHLAEGEIQNLRVTARGIRRNNPARNAQGLNEPIPGTSGETVDFDSGNVDGVPARVARHASAVEEVRQQFGSDIPSGLMLAIINRESRGRFNAVNNDTEARGLFQMKPIFQEDIAQNSQLDYSSEDEVRNALFTAQNAGQATSSTVARRRQIEAMFAQFDRYENNSFEYRGRGDQDGRRNLIIHHYRGSADGRSFRRNVVNGDMTYEEWLNSEVPPAEAAAIRDYVSEVEQNYPQYQQSLARADAREAAREAAGETTEEAQEEAEQVEDVASQQAYFEQQLEQQQDAFNRGLNRSLAEGEDFELPQAIPSDIPVPRNPEAMEIVSNYLKELHRRAFSEWQREEKELRGENRRLPKAPDPASVPQQQEGGRADIRDERSSEEIMTRAEREAEQTGRTVDEVLEESTNDFNQAGDN